MGVGPFLILIILRFYWPHYKAVGPSGRNLFILRVYRHSLFGRPSGGRGLFVLRFYGHSLFDRTSGGPIFRCTTKDRGERRAKGLQSRPLESGFYTGVWRGDVRTFLRVRPGAINAI